MENNNVIVGFNDEKNDDLKIKIDVYRNNPKIIIVYAIGCIDTYSTPFFQKKMNLIIKEGFNNIVLNMSGLNYMSSTGVGSLTAILKSIRPMNGKLVLVGIQSKIYDVLQLLGFSQFFDVRDNNEVAIEYITDKINVSIFPTTVECPICLKKMKTQKAGKFRCGSCKTILIVDNIAKVYLG